MSRKWLRAHVPAVAALALALGSIGGTTVAVAADASAAGPSAVSPSHSAAAHSAAIASSDTTGNLASPLIWYPPA
jgi:hypothetical protein